MTPPSQTRPSGVDLLDDCLVLDITEGTEVTEGSCPLCGLVEPVKHVDSEVEMDNGLE